MTSQNKFPNLELFPIVNIERVSIPERNFLISLPPIGIGTPEVESLSSYISRLAREYFVAPNHLLKACVERYFGSNSYLKDINYNINSCKRVNGLDKITETAVSSIEKATGRQDVIYMTLLPWQTILSPKQMKYKRAWCSACFQSDLENKTPVYERLLWKIDVVESCPIHNQNLTSICPHCESEQASLSTYSFPGFCSHCKTWVGESHSPSLQGKASDFSIWISSEIGNIIAASHKARKDIQARIVFANSIRSIMDNTPYFTYSCLRHKTGLAANTIKKLVFAEMKISFRVLIKLCRSFDCSAVDILLGNKFNLTEKKTVK